MVFVLRTEGWKWLRFTKIWGKKISDRWKSKTKCGKGHGKFRKQKGDQSCCCTESQGKTIKSWDWRVGQNLVHHSLGLVFYSRCNIKTLPHFRQVEAVFDFDFKKSLWLSVRLVFFKWFRGRITCGSCWNVDPTSVSLDWSLRLCTSSTTAGPHFECQKHEKYIVLREKRPVRRKLGPELCFSNFNISYFMIVFFFCTKCVT